MTSTEVSAKIMVDLVLYNKLGPNPTVEVMESLLNGYRTGSIQSSSPELLKHLIDRLTKALEGESLYADWHKRFRKRVQEILKRS
jgi:hypothetical protein